MTARLYCRECGWQLAFWRKRAALRAAARHRCTGIPVAESCPPWWTRLWITLCTGSVRKAAAVTEAGAKAPAVDGDLVDTRGDRVQWAVLAVHHAETTRRARAAMADIVRAGYQIGPPPYGYRVVRVRVTGPTGNSRLRAVLVQDWQAAAVVKQIFGWRADDGLTFAAIAARLNSDLRQYPAPVPNGRWTAKSVRRIVLNVKYTGRQVWARTVDGRPVPTRQWVISARNAHERLIDDGTFQRAQPVAPGSAAPLDVLPSAA
ncbi:recombinase family protein [Amycolatopsis sp. WGS_07]|uniref:recombinase family protein n=1 Tax=Amycolatopsis sp. WGS_07 TaxID=3076764 RepID=UPI003872C0A0